jgi:hypothetical protein
MTSVYGTCPFSGDSTIDIWMCRSRSRSRSSLVARRQALDTFTMKGECPSAIPFAMVQVSALWALSLLRGPIWSPWGIGDGKE